MRREGQVRRPHVIGGAVLAVWAVAGASVLTGGRTAPAADAAATAAPAAPRVAALWRLDEPSGPVAHDAVGAHPAAARGAVTFGVVGPGTTATSARFDGTGYALAAGAGPVPAKAAAAWVRVASGTAGGMVLQTDGLSLGVVDGHPAAGLCADSGCTTVRAPTDIRDGAWHQIAVSVDAGTAAAYVDGRPAAQAPVPGTPRAWGGTAALGAGFHGELADITLYADPLPATLAAAGFRSGACPQSDGAAAATQTTTRRALPALPLHTRGRWIVDARGHRVRLAGVNWYGAEELDRVPAGLQCRSLDAIAAQIVTAGFNVVRLPWATDTWLGPAPAVPPVAVAANPPLQGLDARQVFDAVVATLARHGLMVVLDNHVSRPDWCCAGDDGNALWWEGYDPQHPPAWAHLSRRGRLAVFAAGQRRWLRAWATVAGRYGPRGSHPTRAVIAADLRNEPRADRVLHLSARWSARPTAPWEDWPRAARAGGDLVLRADPRLLVVVEGVHYATTVRGARHRPVLLSRPRRVVYSAHDYAFFHAPSTSAAQLHATLRDRWGYLLQRHRRWTAPVWVSEFGACRPEAPGCADSTWLRAFTAYVRALHGDFAYWAVNGTGARGSGEPSTCPATPRFPGCSEGYGVFNASWSAEASPALSATLRGLIASTR